MPAPKVSVILGSYNRLRFLKSTIASVRGNGISTPFEIIVVDGGSTDGSLKWLARQKDIILIVQHNRRVVDGVPVKGRNWGYFMNLAFKCAQGEYLLMISDDCLLLPGAVENGLNYCDRLRAEGRKVGAGAFYWRNWPEDPVYYVCQAFPGRAYVNHGLYLRSAMAEVGWLDEETYRFYAADCDVCLKMWHRGYEVVECPESFVEHFSHANLKARSENNRKKDDDEAALKRKWEGIFYFPDRSGAIETRWLRHEDSAKTVAQFPTRDRWLRWTVIRERVAQRWLPQWLRLKGGIRCRTARLMNWFQRGRVS